MKEKDWIILLFPILCNGIFLFILTQLTAVKKNKDMQAQLMHQKLICEYSNIIEGILQVFYVEEKSQLLYSLNKKLPLLFDFAVKNKVRIQEYATITSRIEDNWNDLVTVINCVKENNQGIVNGENGKKILFLTNKIFNDLIEMAQMCFSDIYEKGDYTACVEKIGF